ncbi:MAG: hypothetical protein ABI841_04070 [Chloroflexota bacterium]
MQGPTIMSSVTFDRLRLPIALGLGLMLLAGYLFLQRAEADSTALGPSPTIVVGEPGGGVVTPPPTATPSPSPSPVAASTPVPTPQETPTPTPIPPEEEFTAQVRACERISGAECLDEIRRLRDGDETFVALVTFDNLRSGDVMNAILDGPSGPIEGGAFAPEGSGRGWYYSSFAVGGLPAGQYTLTALRNGEPVARIELRKDD